MQNYQRVQQLRRLAMICTGKGDVWYATRSSFSSGCGRDECHFFQFYYLDVLIDSHFLSSAQEVTILAEGKALVKTDISLAIPEGHYGRVGEHEQLVSSPTPECCALRSHGW